MVDVDVVVGGGGGCCCSGCCGVVVDVVVVSGYGDVILAVAVASPSAVVVFCGSCRDCRRH